MPASGGRNYAARAILWATPVPTPAIFTARGNAKCRLRAVREPPFPFPGSRLPGRWEIEVAADAL